MTLKEYADRMWKAQHGDKTYEQVEAEIKEREEKRFLEAFGTLPYQDPEFYRRFPRPSFATIVARYLGLMLTFYGLIAIGMALYHG